MGEDSDGGRLEVSKREFLAMLGGVSAAGAGVTATLDSAQTSTADDQLNIGTMDIDQAYQIDQYRAGPQAARPAAADAEGMLYEVTDAGSGQLTRRTLSDGSQWLTLNVEAETANFGSVDADVAVTERLSYDHSDSWPTFPNQPSDSAGVAIRPHPGINNPVYSAADVSNTDVNQIADPFFAFEDGQIYCFYETIGHSDGGHIGVARVDSPDAWTDLGEALGSADNPHHAYPHAIKYGGEWYMTPVNNDDNLEIYRATSFPTDWTREETALTGVTNQEQTLFRWNGRWWYARDNGSNTQHLYYSAETDGGPVGLSWTEHSDSPISDRWQGRPIVRENSIEVFARPDISVYRISELTTSSITINRQGSSPILASEPGTWTEGNLHHVDVLRGRDGDPNLVVYDGTSDGTDYALGMGVISDRSGGLTDMRVSGQTPVPSGSWTEIAVDNITSKVEPIQPFTGANQIIVQNDGYYRFSGQATFVSTSNTPFDATIRVRNNDTAAAVQTVHEVTGDHSIDITTPPLWAKRNHNIVLQIFQTTGAEQTISGNGGENWFSAHRVW